MARFLFIKEIMAPKEILPVINSFEKVQSYFVDPRSVNVDDLALLGSDAIRAMAQIYATGGDPMKMSSDIREWLVPSVSKSNGVQPDVKRIIGDVLAREASTRRFDNKFMGQIHPQGSQVGILSILIAAYMNTNTVVREVSSAENQMESEALSWFADIFGYDRKDFSGNIVTGGTTANLAALWVARETKIAELKEKHLWKRGMNFYVLGTEMAHYSIMKACDLLGTNVIFLKVPITSQYRTDVKAMQETVEGFKTHGGQLMAIIGLAGETETGQVDDLNSLADIAEKNKVFFHVDAAYGGPFILSRVGHLLSGINRADSITVDPHKLLYTPYQAGAILFKDKRKHMLIEKGMRENARYLLSNEVRHTDSSNEKERNFGMSRPEGSMGSGGVIATWATIQLLNREGIAALLNHNLDITKYAFERIGNSHLLHALHEPDTNSILIGLNDLGLPCATHNEYIKIAKERLDKQGWYISVNDDVDCSCGDKRRAYRFVAMHPFTTVDDVETLFTGLEREISNQLEER
jgi:glutamate/tyrosine decarboxylase-like PLP-dependent enzyme